MGIFIFYGRGGGGDGVGRVRDSNKEHPMSQSASSDVTQTKKDPNAHFENDTPWRIELFSGVRETPTTGCAEISCQ